MANVKEPLDLAAGQQIDAVLQRLRNSKDVGADLLQVLDIAIGITGADMGTLQRFDERADCLTIVASRGFSTEALICFGVVRRDTNTTCAAALMRRMRVFVENVRLRFAPRNPIQLRKLSMSKIELQTHAIARRIFVSPDH